MARRTYRPNPADLVLGFVLAVVGVLSTQLLHRRLIEETHGGSDDGVAFRTEVDRVG